MHKTIRSIIYTKLFSFSPVYPHPPINCDGRPLAAGVPSSSLIQLNPLPNLLAKHSLAILDPIWLGFSTYYVL